MELPGKPPRESRVEMVEHVFPNDTNPHGTIFGGRVMALIDVAAAIASTRHSRRQTVTASVDEVVFHAAVKMGHVLLLEAIVNEAFSTSMEIGVNVWSENPLTGERRHTTTAYTTFVALDDLGQPTRVPPLLPETEEEKQRQAAARERKADRMARRKKHENRE
jgi:acyl-CoA hydrolase